MSTNIFRESPDAVSNILGHRHYVLVANGTCALAGLISVLGEPGIACELPAIACRSLTIACLTAGTRPLYTDVGVDDLKPIAVNEDGLRIEVSPWFGPVTRISGKQTIADLSVNLSPNLGTPLASVASLGPGKPGYWTHRGAIVATDCPEVMRRFSELITMENQQEIWTCVRPRVTTVEVDTNELDEHFKWVSLAQSIRELQVQRLIDWIKRVGVPITTVGGQGGNSDLLPVLLPKGVSASWVSRRARETNVPIGTQPVCPAYLEPAMQGYAFELNPEGVPVAEAIATRLMFVAVSAVDDSKGLDRLARLLERAAQS